MADGDPQTLGAAPWYKSPVQIAQVTSLLSALVAMCPRVGVVLGLNSPNDVSNAVTTVFAFIAIAAPLVGTVLRARSTIQPLTLTQASADNHPATVAKESSK